MKEMAEEANCTRRGLDRFKIPDMLKKRRFWTQDESVFEGVLGNICSVQRTEVTKTKNDTTAL